MSKPNPALQGYYTGSVNGQMTTLNIISADYDSGKIESANYTDREGTRNFVRAGYGRFGAPSTQSNITFYRELDDWILTSETLDYQEMKGTRKSRTGDVLEYLCFTKIPS